MFAKRKLLWKAGGGWFHRQQLGQLWPSPALLSDQDGPFLGRVVATVKRPALKGLLARSPEAASAAPETAAVATRLARTDTVLEREVVWHDQSASRRVAPLAQVTTQLVSGLKELFAKPDNQSRQK